MHGAGCGSAVGGRVYETGDWLWVVGVCMCIYGTTL